MEYFIHIGPPKTATTSLQEYFINNKFKDISYEGVLQPRTRKDKTLCKSIYRKVTSKHDLKTADFIELIQNDSDPKIKFLSEEMFLVESKGMSWKDKIERLYQLTSLIDTTILLVIREPVSAIRSYYQELYYQIDKAKIKSINEFAKSNYCEIYRYDDLIKFISQTGFKKIKILEFKKLTSGQYSFDDVFNNLNKEKIILSQSNISKKKGKNYYANNATIKKLIITKTPSSIKKIFGARLKSKLFSLIPDLKLNKGEKLSVEIKKEVAKDFLESYEKVLSYIKS